MTGSAKLRVVYAGDQDSDRTRSFEKFLGERFGSVRVVVNETLAEEDLSDADVLVIDGKLSLKEQQVRAGTPQGMTLAKLSMPTVLIGGVGGRVADQLKLKLGWSYG